MLEYVYIKLTTGEDIISYKTAESPMSMTLSKPIVIRYTQDSAGNMKPAAAAYCGLAKNNIVELYKSACVFSSEMREEAKAYYSSLAEQHYGAIEQSIANQEYKTSTSKQVDPEDTLSVKDDLKIKFH